MEYSWNALFPWEIYSSLSPSLILPLPLSLIRGRDMLSFKQPTIAGNFNCTN